MGQPRRFLQDTSGNVAIIFGLAALPTLLMIGAGVDYSRAVTEKAKLRIGTDAAVLAGIQAARRNASKAAITSIIQSMVQANDSNPAVAVKPYTLSEDGTTLCVDTTSQITTAIMSLAHVTAIPVGAHACSKMNIDTYEIALAIDNSGSMRNSANNGQTKIQAARTAANGLISALTPTGSTANVTASFSLVPFAASVNIGAGYKTAAFMDTQGLSSIHWENINRVGVGTNVPSLPKSRFDIYTALGVPWAGCVEERPGTMVNDDTKPSTANPDSLYVPMFAPDEVDGNSGDLNQYVYDTGASGGAVGGDCTTNDINNQPNAQTRLCKYYGQKPNPNSYSNAFGMFYSPNMGCTTTALTPLDATTSDVTAALSAMQPNGDTTELAGVMWAWRTISPNGPFVTTNASTTSGQQNPKPYNYIDPKTNAPNHKVLILLTDGEDHWVGQYPDPNGTYPYGSADPNQSLYSSLGFFGNNRLGSTTASNARGLVDNATITACTNAKKLGVEIFTIGLLASDGISDLGKSLLQQCATDNNHYFIAADGNQLVAYFQAIAVTLTKPRIAT